LLCSVLNILNDHLGVRLIWRVRKNLLLQFLKKVIERYVYTGEEPLPDPDIVDLIQRKMKIAERGPTRKRVLERVVDYVTTFIKGIAA